jgi:hypothetical protein
LRVALVVVAVAHRRLGPKLLSHDLDHRPGTAVVGGPAPLLEPTRDYERLPACHQAMVFLAIA